MIGFRIGDLALQSLLARGPGASLVLDLPSKNSASDRPPSKSHVASWLSARAWIAFLNEGQSFISPEKCSGLSFSFSSMRGRRPRPPNKALSLSLSLS